LSCWVKSVAARNMAATFRCAGLRYSGPLFRDQNDRYLYPGCIQ
jgi:hypothetical protein